MLYAIYYSLIYKSIVICYYFLFMAITPGIVRLTDGAFATTLDTFTAAHHIPHANTALPIALHGTMSYVEATSKRVIHVELNAQTQGSETLANLWQKYASTVGVQVFGLSNVTSIANSNELTAGIPNASIPVTNEVWRIIYQVTG
nr:hypothetical protein Itr_chr01CG04040 [Ipomoea trifida]